MGKRRIEIKKIHNKSNRQITYSKRRNGILKKSYELATLCGAEIALIMFSPSRRTLTYFTANNSIEDILTKVVDLPEQVTKGLCNKEELQMIIEKIKYDNDIASLLEKNSGNNDESIIENLQYEIQRAHDELDDTEYKLRLYEGDPIRLSSLRDVECNEQLLRETLNRVRSLRQHMDGNYLPNVQPTTPAHNANNYGFLANNPNWIPPQHQELQFMNCFDSNGLLPTRNEAITPAGFLPPAPIHGNNMNLTAHMGSGVATTSSQAHHEVFGHVNGNLPQFTEPTEVDSSSHEQQGGEPFLALRRFLDL